MMPLDEAIALHVLVAFLFGICAGYMLDRVMRLVLDWMARRERRHDEAG
jgi:hypothetical protein